MEKDPREKKTYKQIEQTEEGNIKDMETDMILHKISNSIIKFACKCKI